MLYFLHHNLVSVGWIYCVRVSGPKFGLLTVVSSRNRYPHSQHLRLDLLDESLRFSLRFSTSQSPIVSATFYFENNLSLNLWKGYKNCTMGTLDEPTVNFLSHLLSLSLHICECVCVKVCMCVYVYGQVCLCPCMCISVSVCLYLCIWACMSTCLCLCLCISVFFVCMYLCVYGHYVCMWVYVNVCIFWLELLES